MLDFPHAIIAPWARCDGPSVAQHSSRGILPLNPLRNDCVRPAEKGRYPGPTKWTWRSQVLAFDLKKLKRIQTLSSNSVEKPRQEAECRCCVEGRLAGCQTRHVGPRMARLADPRSGTGTRGVERSETRMSGALSLWLLSLLREQRESDSPRGETST